MKIAAPTHIGIIMDGNGRWAKRNGSPKRKGHERGVEALRTLIREIKDIDLQYLTLYGFSSENWNRPIGEVNDLMGLLRLYISRDLDDLVKNDVRIRVLGERNSLSSDIIGLIERAERKSKDNTRFNLCIAFNYGGRVEITTAARRIAEQVKAGELAPDAITPELFENYLYTAGIPHPDLIIRTSGEMRLSNFLTWQSAYSELVFTDVLWPDFTREHLLAAIAEYYSRDRRYGGRPEELTAEAPETGSGSDEKFHKKLLEFGKAG